MVHKKSKAYKINVRDPKLIVILAVIVALIGALFTIRISRINKIASEITIEPGNKLALSGVEWYDQVSSKAMVQPTEGSKYITITLGVTNRSQSELWVTPVTQAFVTDTDNNHHGIELVATENPFQAGPVKAGDGIKGELSFMVPSNDSNLKFCYYLEGTTNDAECIALNKYNQK